MNEKKLLPSKVHIDKPVSDKPAPTGSRLALLALEEELEPEILRKYEARWAEGYDIKDDPLYNAWSKLKLKVSRSPLSDITNKETPAQSHLDSLLQVPDKVDKNPPVKTSKGMACLPKHL